MGERVLETIHQAHRHLRGTDPVLGQAVCREPAESRREIGTHPLGCGEYSPVLTIGLNAWV